MVIIKLKQPVEMTFSEFSSAFGHKFDHIHPKEKRVAEMRSIFVGAGGTFKTKKKQKNEPVKTEYSDSGDKQD